ncbi:outer membrane protein assembly factor BamA, partial [archaeon]|nr:outer membrane protein assembly factor BamA [archaeon]
QELQDQLDADLSEDDLLAQKETLKPRSIFIVTPGVTFDTRDSFTRPRKGYFASYTMDISKGLLNSRDIDNFIKYRIDCRTFFTPFERITFAWMGRAGYIQPTNNADKIPDDQIFYLGGILDVRGYDDNMLLYDANGNPVGGRLLLLNSVEARLAIIDNLELALFVDTGSLRITNNDPVVPEVRSSYGTGLRYITPIGPISLLYGHKFRTEEGESRYKWHFSLGYTF